MNDAGSQTFDLRTDPKAGIQAAARAVADGKCIVIPTDTVYGIGADAFSKPAVKRLLRAKRRGSDMPPPVLIAERVMLRALTTDVPEAATALANRHWPGALTLVLTAQRSLRLELGETDGTVAVRVPDHDELRELLRHTGPLAVSSANVSGQAAALTCAEAEEMLGAKVLVYLDGGAAPGPGTSTIVDFASTPTGRVLRQGLIPFEVLLEDAPDLEPVAAPEELEDAEETVALEAPDEETPAETGPDGSEADGSEPAEDGTETPGTVADESTG